MLNAKCTLTNTLTNGNHEQTLTHKLKQSSSENGVGHCIGMGVTTKPTRDTVHSPTLGQLHVESIQLACTCALCCCYALCMKREELLIFYSFWLRCFVDMLQYVGFLG